MGLRPALAFSASVSPNCIPERGCHSQGAAEGFSILAHMQPSSSIRVLGPLLGQAGTLRGGLRGIEGVPGLSERPK